MCPPRCILCFFPEKVDYNLLPIFQSNIMMRYIELRCRLLSILAVMSFLLVSCENIVLDPNQEAGTSPASTDLNILTRTSDGSEISFPLHIYAFAGNGELQAQARVADAQTPVRISLAKGQAYRLVVVSADESCYELPEHPGPSSLISFASGSDAGRGGSGYAWGKTLMMGFADVQPTTSSSATCSVLLQHQMASLELNLTNVPSSCSELAVTVSSPYTGVSLAGIGQQTLSASRIPLTSGQEADGSSLWSVSSVFLFPTAAPQTTFTISYMQDGAMQYSAVTYQGTLRAGTPYVLNGSYHDDGFEVNANVSAAEWNAPVCLNFGFGQGLNPVLSGDGQEQGGSSSGGEHADDGTTVSVPAIPAPFSIWENHVVAAVLDKDGVPVSAATTDATLLLISRDDWSNMTSATNQSSPTLAFDLEDEYLESGLAGWRIPTEDEARILYQAYRIMDAGSSASSLAKVLDSVKADPIVLTDEKGENVRYLCAEAKKTYSYSSSSVLAAGKTVKSYHLRLVRTVKVSTVVE